MEQQVKDSALSLQQLGPLLWHGFDPWPREVSHAAGTAKKKKMVLSFYLQIFTGNILMYHKNIDT